MVSCIVNVPPLGVNCLTGYFMLRKVFHTQRLRPDYMANFSPASERNPLEGCNSARVELHPGLKKSHVIETEFQPGLKSRKQYGCH